MTAKSKRGCTVCGNELSGQQVKYCSNKCKQKAHYDRRRANPNSYYSQTIRALRRKLKLVNQFGGACAECGYAHNLAALHFHHRQAREKRFPLDGRNLSNRKLSDLLEEAQKCLLLCANCHAEAHHPESSKERVRAFLEKHG